MHCGHVSCGGLCRRYGSPTTSRPNLRNSMSSSSPSAYSPRGDATPRLHSPSFSPQYRGGTPPPRSNAPQSRSPYTPHQVVRSPMGSSPGYSPGYSTPPQSPHAEHQAYNRHGHRVVDEGTETQGTLALFPAHTQHYEEEHGRQTPQYEAYHRAPPPPSPRDLEERWGGRRGSLDSRGSAGRSGLASGATARGCKCPHVSCETAPCRRFPTAGLTFGESSCLDNMDYARPQEISWNQTY